MKIVFDFSNVGMENNILKVGMIFEWFKFNLGMRFE